MCVSPSRSQKANTWLKCHSYSNILCIPIFMLFELISICEYKSIYLHVDWYATWISPISCKMSRIQCGKRKATLGVIWTYGGVWLVYMYFRFDPSRKSNLKKEIVTTTPISFYTIILLKIFCTFLYICIIVWYMSTYFFYRLYEQMMHLQPKYTLSSFCVLVSR